MVLNSLTKQWSFAPRSAHTALYSGIDALSKTHEVVHVGWTGNIVDENGVEVNLESEHQSVRDALEAALSKSHCVPVFLTRPMSNGHYEGYCKTDLWNLFHYILLDQATNGSVETQNWHDYQSVNIEFAKKIASVYTSDDVIWIQDYHLLLVPEALRNIIPTATIGYFLHTPFPSSEIFRSLPRRKEILQGVLKSNLIGFQTYSYARHFISSCTRVLGLESSPKGVEYNGSQVSIRIFPAGIDVDEVKKFTQTPSVLEKLANFKEMFSNKKVILGRDKTDQVNGVKHKLLAFEKFLQMFPEYRNKIVLVQVTSPPPNELPKIASQVTELVSRINAQFGSLEFTPVRHFHQHLDQEEYIALLKLADVALVTSVRDSMNATCLEFIVCQEEGHSPLILSEFSGTAGSLSASLLVNPWDYKGVAQTMHDALSMSREEKTNRHQQLYDQVVCHSASYWSHNFVKELLATIEVAEALVRTSPLDIEDANRRFKNAKKRLLLLDYDGTLTDIQKTPGAAIPPQATLDALKTLCADPKNHIYIISGRDQAFLEGWLGDIKYLGLSAEHGCFLKYAETEKLDWINLMKDADASWKSEVEHIFNYYTERTPGSFVEHKTYAITWHYRLADPEYGTFQAKECHNHLENSILSKLPVEVLVGKKNLEVRPVSINKGEIVKVLIGTHSEWDFIFCAGDDKTDEDMFKVLKARPESEEKSIITCMVGPVGKKTTASWHVDQPKDLIKVLSEWAVSSKSSI